MQSLKKIHAWAQMQDPLSIKLLCLYLVQHMLHQIKAQQFHTNFLLLISPFSQTSIFEEEF